MSAIWGVVGLPPGDAAQRLAKARSELNRYGGDRFASAGVQDALVAIDLKVMLPEDRFDRQPLSLPAATILVADARVDNRGEIAAALGILQSDSSTFSDSDLIAAAWMRWGVDCFHRLIGPLAIAVYDPREHRLILARDPTGERPLYVARVGGTVRFASMPSVLLTDPDVPNEFDYRRIAEAMLEKPVNDDRSFFDAIKRIKPGHIVEYRSGQQVASRRYWQPSFRDLKLPSDDAYADAYREVLETSVAAQSRRCGRLSAYLSAGFDSSGVAATAAMLNPDQPIIALTSSPRAGFDGPTFAGRPADESAFAAMTARRHDMDHVIVRPRGRALDHVAEQTLPFQNLTRNFINGGWDAALLDEAARRGATVALTGEWGNLTLNAGAPFVLNEFLSRGDIRRWWSEIRAGRRRGMRWRSLAFNSFDRWIPDAFIDLLYRHLYGLQDWEGGFVASKWRDPLKRQWTPPVGMRGPVSTRRFRFAIFDMLDPGLSRKGSLAMSGVDVRDPLADRRVIEFGLSLPPEQLWRDGMASPLARRALADRVPAQILDQRIRGHQSADWYERLAPDDVRRYLADVSDSPAFRDLVDEAELDRALREWPSEGLNSGPVINRYTALLPTTVATGYFLKCFEEFGRTRGA